jgi:hypothetical protein
MTGHVLQVDRIGKTVTDDGHDILCDTVRGLDPGRSSVESGADLFPASLVTAEGAHDHHVVRVGPQRFEGLRSSFHQVT